MRQGMLQRLIGFLGTVFALFALSAPVEAGYAQPSQANILVGDFVGFVGNFGQISSQYGGNHLVGEVSAFAADFSQWSAQHGNFPLEIMMTLSKSEGGQAVLFLFCCWLYEQFNESHGGTLSGPPSGSGTSNSPTGTVLAGPPTDGSPPLVTKGGDDPKGTSGDQGSSSVLGNGSPGNGDSPKGTVSLANSDTKGQTSPLGDPAAVPVPAAFTMMATGALGLLLGWRKQKRVGNAPSTV